MRVSFEQQVMTSACCGSGTAFESVLACANLLKFLGISVVRDIFNQTGEADNSIVTSKIKASAESFSMDERPT